MTRKRYRWDIQCEQFSKTSSKGFYEMLQRLRYLFYSDEEIMNFPDYYFGHSHSSSEILNHDPEHENYDFHYHT